MANLLGQDSTFNYKGILNLNTLNGGLTGSLQAVEDGTGTASPLQLSTTTGEFVGLFSVNITPGTIPEYLTNNPVAQFLSGSALSNKTDWAVIASDARFHNTISGSYENWGFLSGTYTNIDSGVSQTGQSTAYYGESLRNYYGTADNGTLSHLYGARFLYGHYGTDPAATPITSNAYGLFLYPYNQTGTITSMYDLYIAQAFPTLFSSPHGTITDHWGLYQVDLSVKNYFGGRLGVGQKNATSFVHVTQSTLGIGVVTNSAGGTAVTGTGTTFLDTFKIGDTVTINGQTVAISAIADNTHMTTAAITLANTNVVYTLVGGDRFRVESNGNIHGNENGGYANFGGVFFGFDNVAGVNATSVATQTSSSFLKLYGGGTTQGGRVDVIGGSNSPQDASGCIVFRSGISGVSPEVERIDANGNHGINVSNPSNRFQVQGNKTAGTGTISSSGTAITGVGTLFLTELKVGDSINIIQVIDSSVTVSRRVTAIADDTHCTVDSTYVHGANNPNLPAGTTFTKSRPVFTVSSAGVIIGNGVAIAASFSGVGTATTVFTVTIGSTMANSTYKVNVTPTALLSAALFYVTNKTATAFDVTYLAGLTGTVTFDWAVFP